jgi:ATP-dependent Lhr-like helicase
VKGVSKTDWKGKGWDITHTRIRQKMKEILGTDTMYPYLSESCKVKLSEMRSIAKKTGIIDYGIIRLSTSFYRIFPWVGTQQYATLVRLLHMSKIDVTYTDHDEVYIDIVWTKSPEELVEILEDAHDSITSTQDLTLLPDDVEILKEKYYDFIPPELLLKEVREDYFDIEGLQHDWQVSFDFTAVVQPPFPKLLS